MVFSLLKVYDMSFTSLPFLMLFLPVSLIVYWALKRYPGIQNVVLVLCSLVFYILLSPSHLQIVVICFLVTYCCGIAVEHMNQYRSKICIMGVCINLGFLLLFKYTGALLPAQLAATRKPFSVFIGMPLGFSFLVFTCTAYLFSLMRKRIEPEKNLINMALYVFFYPAILSGPIKYAENFMPQTHHKKELHFKDFEKSIFLFLWGAFLKMVLADRISIFTGSVFADYKTMSGESLTIAALLYSFQLYGDFCGYSLMAVAVAGLYGYNLPMNFHFPYLSRTIKEFWRNWHISLSKWLTQNIYIPLGGSRKGKLRQCMNILVVFVISGLWHGNAASFLAWGILHAVMQITELLTTETRSEICNRLNIDRNSRGHVFIQRVLVFLAVSFAWIFFRMPTIGDALAVCRRILLNHEPWVLVDGTLSKILTFYEWNILIAALLLLGIVEHLLSDGKFEMTEQPAMIRILICSCLIILIFLFGEYGPAFSATDFIYIDF